MAFSFAKAAVDRGVEFLLETIVTKILTNEERVTGVETMAGVIEAPVVLVAAGAWANELLTPIGIDLGMRSTVPCPCHAVSLASGEVIETHDIYNWLP